MSDHPPEFADYLTVAEAAVEAKLKWPESVRNAIQRKRLPAIVVHGRTLIRRADFETWMATKKRGRPKKEQETKESGTAGGNG